MPHRPRPWLTRDVKVLCGVSFLQDAASELLYPVLPVYWRVLAVLTAFNLVNFPGALLLLRAHDLGLSTALVVATYAVYNFAYAALSYPAGALSDRLSRQAVVAAGLVFFAAGYLGLGLFHSAWAVFAVIAVYGGFNACTDGVGKAWVSSLAPTARQGTAKGLYQGATGVAALLRHLGGPRLGP
jgi:MFS family permease